MEREVMRQYKDRMKKHWVSHRFKISWPYMIRVGSIDSWCDNDTAVTGREAAVPSSDTDGVLNGDCLWTKSAGESSIV
jgi:hypothetical protein